LDRGKRKCTRRRIKLHNLATLTFTLVIIIIIPFLLLLFQIKEGRGNVKEHKKGEKKLVGLQEFKPKI